MFTKNVGQLDRVIRAVTGFALLFAAYKAEGPAVYILAVAAGAAIITGLIGYCGLYKLLGINTCKVD
ncbi:MAG: DUF2892 domain-containing protein [Elusimicrobiales bacterium]|nr:DUF2892 domain-containing protein [Elusimicrobiales bacterium]